MPHILEGEEREGTTEPVGDYVNDDETVDKHLNKAEPLIEAEKVNEDLQQADAAPITL